MTAYTWKAPGVLGLVSPSVRVGSLLALQFAFQPMLNKWFVSPEAIKSTLVLVCELMKLIVCVGMLVAGGNEELLGGSWTPMACLRDAGVPSVTYTVQNLLTQTAYRHLDSVTFNVVNQTKILFNALFVRVLLGNGQSAVQMVALLFIFTASVLVSLSEGGGDMTDTHEDFILGIACAAGGAALSGVGSAFTERVLVRNRREPLLFSAELAALSCCSVLLNLLLDLNGDGLLVQKHGLFASWTPSTFVPIMSNAFGGIVVGLVTKRLGSVRKGLAVTCGLILSAFLSVVLMDKPLRPVVALSVPLACAGIFLHVAHTRFAAVFDTLMRWQRREPAVPLTALKQEAAVARPRNNCIEETVLATSSMATTRRR